MLAMIVPGNGHADVSQLWYPYAKYGLEKLGLQVIAENMPDPELARMKYWLPFIKQKLHGSEKAILVGHSSGAIAIMRYLEENRLLGAVLVGAYYTDLGIETEKLSGYFDAPWRWSRIRENAGWILQFSSPEDPLIPIQEARLVSGKIGAEHYELSNRGHFMESEFPELIRAIKKKLGKK